MINTCWGGGGSENYVQKSKKNRSRGEERIEKAARNNAKDLIWQIAIFFILFSDIDIQKI